MFTSAATTKPATTNAPQAQPTHNGGSVARYNLFNAWPNATGDVLQQEWSIVYETIQR